MMVEETVGRLRREVIDVLKRRFVGRDEVVDLIALAVVAGEHLFLFGPPGTAKSALIRRFATAVQGRYFEYLLTRFSEPNEVFGPIDLVRLREGTVATVTTGMLPEAEFVFLDELFNANSAILNNLLSVLNERVYRRGAQVHHLPVLSVFSASNHLPEEDALRALFDRFLLRCHVDNLKREAMPRLLAAGWELEGAAAGRVDGLGLRPARAVGPAVPRRPDGGVGALCRGGLQGARPRDCDVRPARDQGDEAGRGLGLALRARGGEHLRLLGPPLRLGPRGADRPAGLADRRRPRAARRRARCASAGGFPGRVDGEELARQLDAAEAESAPGRSGSRRWPGSAIASPTWPTAPPGSTTTPRGLTCWAGRPDS